MKWIKYDVKQSDVNGKSIFVSKKVEYSEANLAIAEKEAYNDYEVIEDDKKIAIGKNLLVNSNFVNPVNSRKLTEKYGAGFWIDKWLAFTENNTPQNIGQVEEDGILLNNFSANIKETDYVLNVNLAQMLPYDVVDNLKGKTVTFSVGTGLGDVLSLTAEIPTELLADLSTKVIAYKEFDSFTLYIANRAYLNDSLFVGIKAITNGSMGTMFNFKVRWAKLEIGSKATPFIAKPYEEELRDCLLSPLVLQVGPSDGLKLDITDTTIGDEVLDAILKGRQILVITPNKANYTETFSPVYMYQLPNIKSDYLYLFYLRDEKQTIDLSAMGLGQIEMPIYGEIQLKLSKTFKSCPIYYEFS